MLFLKSRIGQQINLAWSDAAREAALEVRKEHEKQKPEEMETEHLQKVERDSQRGKPERRAARLELIKRGKFDRVITWKPKPKFEKERGEGLSDEDIARNFNTVHNKLISEGHVLNKKSTSGSRYYSHPDGSLTRIADHSPNAATQDWIDKNDVNEIRVDRRKLS